MTALRSPGRLPTADFILTGVSVLAGAGFAPYAEEMDLVIADGVIAALAPGAGLHVADAERIDGRGLLVLPGLVNAHTHSCETLRRGVAAGAAFDAWVATVWKAIDRLSDHEVSVAVMLGAAEMLKRGTTAVLDHFRQIPMRLKAIEAAAGAYQHAGLRATIAIMLRDPGADGASGSATRMPNAQEQLSLCLEAMERNSARASLREHGAARRASVSLALGPSAPVRCSDDFLVAAAAVATSRGALLHMHVDETAAQRSQARQRYGGVSAVRHLHDLGILGPHLSIAHAVWIDPGDIDLLAESATTVVHNPASNMRLGSGRAPVAAMQRAGVTVALGTDGAASNDGQDLFEAAKLAVLLSRSPASDVAAPWLGPRDALRMATDGGRAVLGLPPLRIAAGMAADLIAIDLDSPPLVPLNDIEAQLVLGGPAIKVRHVFVDGRCVVRDGVLTQIDEAALYAEARAITRGLTKSAAV